MRSSFVRETPVSVCVKSLVWSEALTAGYSWNDRDDAGCLAACKLEKAIQHAEHSRKHKVWEDHLLSHVGSDALGCPPHGRLWREAQTKSRFPISGREQIHILASKVRWPCGLWWGLAAEAISKLPSKISEPIEPNKDSFNIIYQLWATYEYKNYQ